VRLTAISRSLDLFADVFESGLTADMRASLAKAGIDLPERRAYGSDDEERARHHTVLGYAVLPYGGMFLSDDGLIGGESERVVCDSLVRAGLAPETTGAPPEHIAGVCRAVARQLERPAGVHEAANLISGHVLAWVPAFVHAVRRQGAVDYADLGDVLIQLFLMTTAAADEVAPANEGRFSSWPEPGEKPPPTQDNDAGIREVANYLCTHSLTGFYLGREVVGRVSKDLGAPRGFGSAGLMLGNLLRSAAHFEALSGLVQALIDEAESYRAMWQSRARTSPTLAHWSRFWEGRLDRTIQVLRTLETAPSEA
jgi:TorA maturation chaperone TorD